MNDQTATYARRYAARQSGVPGTFRPPAPRAHAWDLSQTLSVWAIWLFLAGNFVREVLGQSEVLAVGDYNVHSVDPGIAMALVACAGHLARARLDWRAYTAPIAVMILLISVNFLRGVAVDPFAALLWARANGSIAALLLLAACVRPTPGIFRAVRNALIAVSAGLAVIVLMRLAGGPNLFMINGNTALEANDGGRALSVFGTFLMVLTSGLVTSEILERRRLALDWRLVVAVALPILILLTRQATASLAEFVTLAMVFVFQPGRLRLNRALLALLGIVAISALLIWVYPMIAGSDDVLRRTGTFEARQEIWRALLELWPNLPMGTQIFGYPAGQYPELTIYASGAYRNWSSSIHSMYFGALPMMGYFGALSYVALLAILSFKALAGTLRRIQPLPPVPLAFCAATAILSYSYEIRGDSLLGLFVAIWWFRASEPKLLPHLPRPAQPVAGEARRRAVRGEKA